jgi:cytochrome c551
MLKKKWRLLLAGAVLAAALSACGNAADNNAGPDANNAATDNGAGAANEAGNGAAGGGAAVGAAAAEAIYKQNCVGCHAVDLSGGVGPNLQQTGGKLSSEEIKKRIANGGGGMPAYKDQLSSADIDALVSWLAAMK